MAEVPSKLYEHLNGSGGEIIARLEGLGLLSAPARRDELAARITALLSAREAGPSSGPPDTGLSVLGRVQSELAPHLTEAGCRLASQRPF